MIVAPHDASEKVTRSADLVCDGVNDEVELLASLTSARRRAGQHDISPAGQKEVDCHARHGVRWLPGTYRLGATLTIPDAMDVVIDAAGSYFEFAQPTGDVVVIHGMNRCRYRLGTIDSHSTGAALAVRPTAQMPSLMSIVSFTGLIGHDQRGVGLLLDAAHENVCVNRFEGTDIAGFECGVRVLDPGGPTSAHRPTRKCDTNQYWFAYIRLCQVCIEEGQTGQGIDTALWTVNVDASIPHSVAIRTAASGGRWTIIMGTWGHEKKNKALVLAPGACGNRFDMRPPIADYAWEDNSGNATNHFVNP